MARLGVRIAEALAREGVETVFGIPGVHNVELYRGIAETGLTHVLARHEQGAGFMADGYARSTGRPGICLVISGPGLTNIMTPMGQAWSDRVPMLVISSCLNETAACQGQLHQMRDQAGAARAVCDWSEEARSAEPALALIARAFAGFRAGRARPVHIQIPLAILESEAPSYAPSPHFGAATRPDEDVARDMAERLRMAERPLLLLGGGASSAAAEARAVVAQAGAASFTTYAGRGVIDGSDPASFGATLARPQSGDIIGQADVVLAVGTELAEVDLWRADLGDRGVFMRIDSDPAVLSARPADMSLCADAGQSLAQIGEALPGEEVSIKWDPAQIAAFKRQWRAEVDAERPGLVGLCDVLRDAVPPDVLIYSDMTQLAYTAKEVWPMAKPGRWHHPYGFGTLGYALPAAIGGAVARPKERTLVVAGDYGFQYTSQELAVAVELGLPLVILLWDNDGLGEIAVSMERAQMPPREVTARNPDFLALARAYGAMAAEPVTLAEIAPLIRAAFEADTPTLIRLTPRLLA